MPSAPVGFYDDGSEILSWMYDGPNPTTWNIYTCAADGSGKIFHDSVAGNVFATDEDDLIYYVIQGVDGTGSPVTGFSNVVNAGN